jgi:hypothetical protein
LSKSLTDGDIVDAVLLLDPIRVALLIDAGDDLYTRINIPFNSVEEGEELMKRCLGNSPVEHYLIKLHEKWAQEYSGIIKKIKIVDSLNDKELLKSDVTKYVFKWTLVKQECEMYCLIGDEVDPKDLKFVCKRRGFDNDMKKFIVDMMRHVGLGEKL